METSEETSEPAWQTTHEAVRDVHRSLKPSLQPIPVSLSHDGTTLNDEYRLWPDVGTASSLAQPGGFRRAHVLGDESASAAQIKRAQAPLEVILEVKGNTPSFFITDVVQRRADGTVLRFESRPYRRGRRPSLLEGPPVAPPPRLPRLFRWRPDLIPWWVTMCYFVGASLFVLGSVCWMVPAVGDLGAGAPEWEVQLTVSLPYMVGALWFTLGAYLALVEVINANMQEELAHLTPKGSLHRAARTFKGGHRPSGCLRWLGLGHDRPVRDSDAADGSRMCCAPGEYRWWDFQPHSLLYWAALVLFVGTLFFGVACVFGFPHALDWAGHSVETHYAAEFWLVYVASITGSCSFVFNTYVLLVEVTHNLNILSCPDRWTLGYGVALLNFLGSCLFLIASFGYLVHDSDLEVVAQWEYYVSEWGVRLPYAIGSFCFWCGALIGFEELVADNDEDEGTTDGSDGA